MRFGLVIFTLNLLLLSSCALASDKSTAYSPQDVLAKLRSGNDRFVESTPNAWKADAGRRELLSSGQHPMACIVTCSDSRVSPEILFDQSIGDLFVCRVAGNVVSPEVTGSIEYAVDHLNVPVVIVLGHTKCGAVQAAISSPDATGPIGSLVSRIKPAVDGCIHSGSAEADMMNCAVNSNANNGCIALIQGSRTIQEKVEKGELILVSAAYDISTGEISWQTQLAAVSLSSAKNAAHGDAQSAGSHTATKTKSSDDQTSASRSKSEKSTSKHTRRH